MKTTIRKILIGPIAATALVAITISYAASREASGGNEMRAEHYGATSQSRNFSPPRKQGRLYDSCYYRRNGRVECNRKGSTAGLICRDLGYRTWQYIRWYTRHQPMRTVWIMRDHPTSPYRTNHRGASYVMELVCR